MKCSEKMNSLKKGVPLLNFGGVPVILCFVILLLQSSYDLIEERRVFNLCIF